MKHISVMMKPASSACNMRCKYCFYADLAGKRDTFSFGKMPEDTLEKILSNIRVSLDAGDSLTIAFQGGEPTLVGLKWYQKMVELVEPWKQDININYALQTNGLLLDDAWCEFLAKNHFLVGISVDALPKFHNSWRLDADGEGTYRRVEESIACMRKHKVEFNVLCTLTSEIARHPQQVWNWIRQNQFSFVQFTPCLDELDAPGKSKFAIHPKRFASFYTQLFRYWLEAFEQGEYISIKLFDDIVNLLAYGMPTACGINGSCQCQMVVESDGSAYPCDFYCLDQYKLGNLTEKTILELRESETVKNFITRPREPSPLCQQCRYSRFCGGGCRRMRREQFYAPGDSVCGYREFLDSSIDIFQRIAMQQRRYRNSI